MWKREKFQKNQETRVVLAGDLTNPRNSERNLWALKVDTNHSTTLNLCEKKLEIHAEMPRKLAIKEKKTNSHLTESKETVPPGGGKGDRNDQNRAGSFSLKQRGKGIGPHPNYREDIPDGGTVAKRTRWDSPTIKSKSQKSMRRRKNKPEVLGKAHGGNSNC